MAKYGWTWKFKIILIFFGGQGGQGGQGSFGFGLDDIFSNFFGGGMRGGGQSGSFSSSTRSQSGSKNSPKCIRAVNSQLYKKEISDQGMTWLLLLYTPMLKGTQNYESIIEEVANSLQGALKVGSINCETDLSFCKDLGVYPCRAPKVLFIHTEQMTVVPWQSMLGIGWEKFENILPRTSTKVFKTYRLESF